VIGYTYTDTVSSGMNHSALYVYDAVNRLACAQATGSATYNLAYSYTQDGSNGQYGNMTCVTSGACPAWTFNSSHNQITVLGYNYDAAGNLTSDAGGAYIALLAMCAIMAVQAKDGIILQEIEPRVAHTS
jgi:hypothetical protein